VAGRPAGGADAGGPRPSPVPALVVTVALLGLSCLLILLDRDPALAGALLSYVAAYWLPTRPNRRPVDPSEFT